MQVVNAGSFRRASAYTLLELLLVIAVIAILIGLLLPAVPQVREAGNRARCISNLRQLALAVQQYHDREGHLPVNQFDGSYGAGPNSTAWSWLAQLLPYVEQETVYTAGDIPTSTLAQSGVADRQISLFLCPSDASSVGPRLDAGNLAGFAVGQTNYKGVSGANWGDDLEGIGPHFATDWRNPGTNGSFDGLSMGDGVFYRMNYLHPLMLVDVRDGLSNTFLIGEDVPALDQWCSWPYANNANGTCAIPPNVQPPGGGEYAPGDWQNTNSFRSRHKGGLHFAFADGSVHFINDSINLTVYRAMATIQGNEQVAEPW
jgi:prepilin-type processing-associated H-X9-DG protein